MHFFALNFPPPKHSVVMPCVCSEQTSSAMGGPVARGHCKVGDTAVDGPQNWCENTLLVLWEDSVALEVVLEQRLGGEMAVEEVGWLRHAGGSCQKRNTPPKYVPGLSLLPLSCPTVCNVALVSSVQTFFP